MVHTNSRPKNGVLRLIKIIAFTAAALFLVLGAGGAYAQSSDPEQSGSVGLTGTISAPPPAQGATISFPRGGTFDSNDVPITVTGVCPDGLLVKLFKNNVFAGSAQCVDGNFSIQTDLFVGENELIARVYDDLDQPGPDSNRVTVNFLNDEVGAPARVTLTSNYAKRGAFPGDELLWPVILSGGSGPYAFSVDWGDGSEPDLFTEAFPGTIDLKHAYEEPGVYNVVIKAVDASGTAAFLQVVGIANGPLSQEEQTSETGGGTTIRGLGSGSGSGPGDPVNGSTGIFGTRIIWWPALFIVPFAVSTFWLGKHHMLKVIRTKLEHGEHPFMDM